MPFPTSENVSLLHFTRTNHINQPVQVAFSVTDDEGREMILTGECPTAELYKVYRERNWLIRMPVSKAAANTYTGSTGRTMTIGTTRKAGRPRLINKAQNAA